MTLDTKKLNEITISYRVPADDSRTLISSINSAFIRELEGTEVYLRPEVSPLGLPKVLAVTMSLVEDDDTDDIDILNLERSIQREIEALFDSFVDLHYESLAA